MANVINYINTNDTTSASCPLYYASYRIGNQGGSKGTTTYEQAVEWVMNTTRDKMSSEKNLKVTWTVKDLKSKETVFERCTTTTVLNNSNSPTVDNIIINKENDMDKKKLTASEKRFLMLSGEDVKLMAKKVMDEATQYLSSEKEEFDAKITTASSGMIPIKQSRSMTRLSFKAWSLFSRLHDKRHPASYNYGRVADVIWNTYLLGRQAFSIDENVQTEQSEMPTAHATDDNAMSRMTINDLVGKVVSNVMVFLSADEYTARYLLERGCKLSEDVERLTNEVLTCDIHGDNIHFKSITGVSEVVNIAGLTRLEIEQALHKLIIRLISNAAITPATHNIVGSVVDLNDLARITWDNLHNETGYVVGDDISRNNSVMNNNLPASGQNAYQREGIEEPSLCRSCLRRTSRSSGGERKDPLYSEFPVKYIMDSRRNRHEQFDDS